jgi:putative phage-type endonuclease
MVERPETNPEFRKTFIGASESAAICGVSPFATPHDIYRAKVNGEQLESTMPMRLGHFIEPFIASEFTRETGHELRESHFYRHGKFEFLGANPDREITIEGVDGLVELKNTSYWPGQQWGQGGADQVPEHYLIQIAHQMMVTGRKFCILAAMIDGRELRTFTYTFDPDLFESAHVIDKQVAKQIAYKCVRFWEDNVLKRVEPPMTGRPSDTAYVKRERSTYENGKKTNADYELTQICKELEPARKAYSVAELAKVELENKIKKYMVENQVDTLETELGNFTFRTDSRGVARFMTPFKSKSA